MKSASGHQIYLACLVHASGCRVVPVVLIDLDIAGDIHTPGMPSLEVARQNSEEANLGAKHEGDFAGETA